MNWWQKVRNNSLTCRPAAPTDRPALADLLSATGRQFGGSAIEDQMTLLNSGLSMLALSGDRVVAFLGLRARTPAGGETWVDLSMAAVAGGWGADKAFSALIDSALPGLVAQQATGLVCLTTDPWLHDALESAGFAEVDQVVTYLRSDRHAAPPASAVAHLRSAGPAEANTILAINAAAFSPIWRYDPATTLSWLLTADHAVLAEVDGRPAAFCITSRASFDGYAQLIRIGTHPDFQGQGIGRQLVTDAIKFSERSGALGTALNTQRSNATSRHLYEALGFRTVGSAVPVLILPLK